MHNFDSAYKTVSELINDFKENERKYLAPAYQEEEVYKFTGLIEDEIKILEGRE
jgi:hypothetical protein